jgi:fucose permease
LLLACVAYLSVALPGSTLGLLWPSIRLSLGQPVGALSAGRSWRQTYVVMALALAALGGVLVLARSGGRRAAGRRADDSVHSRACSRGGSGALAVAGLMLLGLAAAPVFPLFTLTTGTTRMVSLQVAASAVGGAAVPAGLGLLLGAAGPWLLAPALLALGLAMGGLYAFIRPG